MTNKKLHIPDAAVEAAAKAEVEATQGERWADYSEREKEEWRVGQRVSLQAALEVMGASNHYRRGKHHRICTAWTPIEEPPARLVSEEHGDV